MGRRLAIFTWGGLGNTVMALPLINALRQSLGDEYLIMLPQPGFACLISPPGNSIRMASLSGNFVSALAELVSFRPDVVLSSLPYPKWRYGLIAAMSGARTRIGDSGFPNRLLNVTIDTAARATHFVERNLALLKPLGIKNPGIVFHIPISQEASLRAERFLHDQGVSSFIAIHPGAGNPLRRWPMENFRRLCAALGSQGKSVVILAGPSEGQLVDQLSSGLDFKPAICRGSLSQLLPILARARALVAVDSGLAHSAAALSVPTIALMGPSDQEVYRPYGKHVRVLTNQVPCRPCYRPGGRIRCPHRRRLCLDIEVDRVLACLEMMI